MKGILCGGLVLLLVFVIHAVIKCQTTEHQSRSPDQVNNSSPSREVEASSLEERTRNYKILCQQGKLCMVL